MCDDQAQECGYRFNDCSQCAKEVVGGCRFTVDPLCQFTSGCRGQYVCLFCFREHTSDIHDSVLGNLEAEVHQ